MNRRLQLAAVAALAAALLGGCGSSPEKFRAGLVTGPDGSAETEALTSGIDSYAAASSVQTRIYTASADTSEAYAVQFDAAAEDGTAYVLAEGKHMEIPVYEAQNKHTGQQFLLFNGQPRKSGEYEATIRKNTECVDFSVPDLGFLAGYTAVREGYRNVFYLGSEKTGAHLDAYNGFLSGVQYALDEQSLAGSNMTISAEFAGSEELTPLRLSDALNAFDGGAELIVTDVENFATAAGQAAASRGKAVATIGFDGRTLSSGVLFGTVPNLAGAAAYLLQSFDENKDAFLGGSAVTIGARENAVMLAVDYARFGSFTEAGLNGVLAAIADGTATVYKSQAGEEGAESGAAVTETPHTFQVAEVSPTAPNANSGLQEGAAQASEDDAADSAAEGADAEAAAEDTAEESGDAETSETE